MVDTESGVSLSAKRYAKLLQCQAWTEDKNVMIRLPDGREFAAGSNEVAQALSDLLGRDVETQSAEDAETIVHEFPSGITDGEGDPYSL